MKKITKDYCVYRYLLADSKEVIYVGKTDASLKQRIDAHKKEEKFAPYLGMWNVEYVELENRVETDIVEKFLINKFKPALNDKDNVEGLAELSITIPNWKPYEVYEEERKHKNNILLERALKTAKLDFKLFEAVYDAIIEKKEIFVLDFCHPTGMLPLLSEHCFVVNKTVTRTFDGYRYELNTSAAGNISNFPNSFKVGIYIPIAKLWLFETEEQNILYHEFQNAMSFAEKLREFKENGYEGLFEQYVVDFPTNELITKYYNKMFTDVSILGNTTYAEVNCDAYNAIPFIQEEIAKDMMIFFKSCGMTNYDDEEECLAFKL